VLGDFLRLSLIAFVFTHAPVGRTVPITIAAAYPSLTDKVLTFIPANKTTIILNGNYFKLLNYLHSQQSTQQLNRLSEEFLRATTIYTADRITQSLTLPGSI
jgi:hypothetical protein